MRWTCLVITPHAARPSQEFYAGASFGSWWFQSGSKLIIPDEDRDPFAYQARLEDMTLSGWLRAAAEDRIERRERLKPFTSSTDVREFFQAHDDSGSGLREPDWKEHLKTLGESKLAGSSGT